MRGQDEAEKDDHRECEQTCSPQLGAEEEEDDGDEGEEGAADSEGTEFRGEELHGEGFLVEGLAEGKSSRLDARGAPSRAVMN